MTTVLKPISSLMNQDIRHKTVVIDLWDDHKRVLDIVGTSTSCPHLRIENSRCDKCGDYLGLIGYEKDPLLYYKHVDLLSNSFVTSDNVYIITERPYPEDYVLPVFSMSLSSYKGFRYKQVYTIYDSVNPTLSARSKTRVKYVIHYTNNKESFWKNKFIHMRRIDPLAFLDNMDTLLVNPTKDQLKYYHQDFSFFIPNPSIMVLVNESNIRNTIKLLR